MISEKLNEAFGDGRSFAFVRRSFASREFSYSTNRAGEPNNYIQNDIPQGRYLQGIYLLDNGWRSDRLERGAVLWYVPEHIRKIEWTKEMQNLYGSHGRFELYLAVVIQQRIDVLKGQGEGKGHPAMACQGEVVIIDDPDDTIKNSEEYLHRARKLNAAYELC